MIESWEDNSSYSKLYKLYNKYGRIVISYLDFKIISDPTDKQTACWLQAVEKYCPSFGLCWLQAVEKYCLGLWSI